MLLTFHRNFKASFISRLHQKNFSDIKQINQTIHGQESINQTTTIISSTTTKSKFINIDALIEYKKHYNNLDIIQKFVIPKDNTKWPIELQGFPLGVHVHNIRQWKKANKLNNTLIKLLDSYEFIWDRHEYSLQQAINALLLYQRTYGDMYVPRTYIMGSDIPNLPASLYGYCLGETVNDIRVGRRFTNARKRLIVIGFVYDAQRRPQDPNVLLHAVQIYKIVFKIKTLPTYNAYSSSHITASTSTPDLTHTTSSTSTTASSTYISLPTSPTPASTTTTNTTSKCISSSSSKTPTAPIEPLVSHRTDLNIPWSFVVPHNDYIWPANMWGYVYNNIYMCIH